MNARVYGYVVGMVLIMGCAPLVYLAPTDSPTPQGQAETAITATMTANQPAIPARTPGAERVMETPTVAPTATEQAPLETPTVTLAGDLSMGSALVSATPGAPPELPEGEPYVIGSSAGGRALEVYRFGSGPYGRMIVAGIHGGYEWNTVDLAYELIDHIRAHPWVVPEEVTLYILPDLNPDGYARQHGPQGRANDHNVDLNRNWFANWQADWDRTGCWDLASINAGPAPHSEPEVQHLAYFLMTYPVEALISYHSASLGIFAGGQPTDPASDRLAQALARVSDYAYPPVDTGCALTGQLVDWAAGSGIAAVDVELTTHEDTDFQMNLKVMDALMKWR